MNAPDITRRRFAGALGAIVGASLVAPELARSVRAPGALPAARTHSDLPATAIRIDSNENPYGPSPRALEAMERSRGVAARYPDAIEDQVTAALAKLHGVTPDGGCARRLSGTAVPISPPRRTSS